MKKVLKYCFMIGYITLYILFIYYFKVNDFANALSIYILLYLITLRINSYKEAKTRKAIEYKLDNIYRKLLKIDEVIKNEY